MLKSALKSTLLKLRAAGAAAFAAIAFAAGAAASDFPVLLQDRLPFGKQLREEAAELKKSADAADAAGNAADAKKFRAEAARLERDAAVADADAEKDKSTPRSVRQRVEQWKGAETAIIICDMWAHETYCASYARVRELATAMNPVFAAAREKGVLIVHAPSSHELGEFYKNHPARKTGEAFRKEGDFGNRRHWDFWEHANGPREHSHTVNPSEVGAPFPRINGPKGADCSGGCGIIKFNWTQTPIIKIENNDMLTDDFKEIFGYFRAKGIKNVVLTGVHTDMCVLGRPFGLRAMKKQGFNAVLCRDLTDHSQNCNSTARNTPNHYSGQDLVAEYIETYVCPSITSTAFTGKKQYRWREDTRPRVAILTAESEYRASSTLAGFANELTKRDIRVDFALGRPVMEGPGRHDLHNLQILDDANAALVFIRRRALEPAKMAAIKKYVADGRPLFGVRTASHAFDAKGNVARSGGGVVAATGGAADASLAQWPEFDRDVLGGNYQGHYGHLKTGTDIVTVPCQSNHPLLRGVAPAFNSPSWLYKNTPLRGGKITVLAWGKNPGVADEPVLWVNDYKTVYTSLGHWDDWKNPNFKKLAHNTIDFLLWVDRNNRGK